MPPGVSDWILDSGASHHITNDLDQLHLSQPYNGADQLVVGDGTRDTISNIGKTVLHTPNHLFHLSNVLHVPKISQKLLSVSSLCDTNSISIEFFPDCFLVKDLKTRVPILRGQHSNGLYHMPHPPTTPLALTTTTSFLPP